MEAKNTWYEITYSRTGRMACLSHLDFQRLVQRILRRSDLPVAYSSGYSPHIKLSFPYALPLFMEAERERFSILLTKEVPEDSMAGLMNGNSPPGLEFIEIKRSAGRVRDSGNHTYELTVPVGQLDLWHQAKDLAAKQDFYANDRITSFSITDRIVIQSSAPFNPLRFTRAVAEELGIEPEINLMRKKA